MQVYKNTQGIMQQLLHQMNMEEVYCLTRLSFVPWRVVSDLYQLIFVTVIKQHLCQYDLPFTSNVFSAVPGSVRNVTVVIRQSSTTTTAVLTWQQPEEPNGVIIEYQIFYAGYDPYNGPGLQVCLLCASHTVSNTQANLEHACMQGWLKCS